MSSHIKAIAKPIRGKTKSIILSEQQFLCTTVAIVYEHSIAHNPTCPSVLPSLHYILPALTVFSFILPSRLPLVFHAGTSGAQRLQPAGFLACRSSSSAFCFHQWTAVLHFCCVSKYLLAFLFLATTAVGVCVRPHVCVRVCMYMFVWFAC